jgi:hypothetical protein
MQQRHKFHEQILSSPAAQIEVDPGIPGRSDWLGHVYLGNQDEHPPVGKLLPGFCWEGQLKSQLCHRCPLFDGVRAVQDNEKRTKKRNDCFRTHVHLTLLGIDSTGSLEEVTMQATNLAISEIAVFCRAIESDPATYSTNRKDAAPIQAVRKESIFARGTERPIFCPECAAPNSAFWPVANDAECSHAPFLSIFGFPSTAQGGAP